MTKLDEKQIELLRNGSSGNIATVLAKAVRAFPTQAEPLPIMVKLYGAVMPSSWSMVFQ